MCEYCGCDGIPAVAELIAEHDAIRDLARVARQAATADDRPGAVVAVGRIMELLGPHTQIEEQGLFAAMVGEFGGYISSLIGEHIALDAAFAEFGTDQHAAGWQQRLIAALDDLFEHILRGHDGPHRRARAGRRAPRVAPRAHSGALGADSRGVGRRRRCPRCCRRRRPTEPFVRSMISDTVGRDAIRTS